MEAIKFNPDDLKGIRKIIAKYGKKGLLTTGENQYGENIMLSVCEDNVTTETLQSNGWIQVNTYWKDGTVEETYKR